MRKPCSTPQFYLLIQNHSVKLLTVNTKICENLFKIIIKTKIKKHFTLTANLRIFIMNSIILPEATKKRLIQLENFLLTWPNEKITSVAISEFSGWKASLIRHDLWLLNLKKGVSNGYKKDDLLNAIKSALKENQSEVKKNCCIVGLGRLGAALLDETLVENSSFVIKAGFDSNLNRVEILRSSFPLYPANEMQFVIKKEKIEYAILTVKDKDAFLMTQRLLKADVKGIVNLTNTILKVPSNVKVENISILNALNLVVS